MGKNCFAVIFVVVFYLLGGCSPADGDDTDIYGLQQIPPNVLIVLDHSGSMNNDDAGSPYDANQTYKPWVGMPDLGNYGNWENYNRTRWQIAKNVVTHLLDETDGVRFGLMRMDGSSYDTGLGDNKDRMDPPRGVAYEEGNPEGRILRQGGKILCPVGTNKNEIISFINEMPNNDPQTWTVLAETLFSAGQYFAGNHGPAGMGGYKTGQDDYLYVYNNQEYNAGMTDDQGNPINPLSPIEFWCQKNFVILVTDGEANCDEDWPALIDTVGDFDGDGHDGPGANHYLDDVARFLYDQDIREDMDGQQNIVTYTVSFAMAGERYQAARDLLRWAAEYGGGKYYAANNHGELSYALMNIIGEILETSTSYTAPVVPISEMQNTTSGDKIYVALFKPERTAFWRGNIKKFRIATADNPALEIEYGDVLDRNGNRATDAAGHISPTAVSFWGGGDLDGGETELGGVGEVLLNRVLPRNIYTWTGTDRLLAHPANAFTKDNLEVTKEMLQAADEVERGKIIDFLHGFDAFDGDRDSNTTEKRSWILGAFLHSRPEVVHYGGSATVLFAGSNDGMLHAFDDETGEELWAFIPPDLLGRLKNLTGGVLQHFVDGSPRAYIIDMDGDGTIETGDGDRVILVFGERRGGNHFSALDVSRPNFPEMLWEIAPGLCDFSEMAQSWCTPAFGIVAPNKQPVAFISGGYDPNQDTHSVSVEDTMGRGIYVVDLVTGELLWKYTHEEDPEMISSIPSDITAIDTTDSGFVDRLYVGDMGGRLWRFNIGSTDTANWTGEILFDSNRPSEEGRKIFYPPDVTLEEGYEAIFFGTGDRTHPEERTVIDRIYAIKDRSTGGTLDESSLVDVTDDLLQDPSTPEEAKTTIRDNLANREGWFIRLADHPGEKVLAPPLVFAGVAYFSTFTPTPESMVDPCLFEEGLARLYALNYRTGEAVFNWDMSNDVGGQLTLMRGDRSQVIGYAIPSGLVVSILRGKPSGYIGIGGGILNTEIRADKVIIRMYWRELLGS